MEPLSLSLGFSTDTSVGTGLPPATFSRDIALPLRIAFQGQASTGPSIELSSTTQSSSTDAASLPVPPPPGGSGPYGLFIPAARGYRSVSDRKIITVRSRSSLPALLPYGISKKISGVSGMSAMDGAVSFVPSNAAYQTFIAGFADEEEEQLSKSSVLWKIVRRAVWHPRGVCAVLVVVSALVVLGLTSSKLSWGQCSFGTQEIDGFTFDIDAAEWICTLSSALVAAWLILGMHTPYLQKVAAFSFFNFMTYESDALADLFVCTGHAHTAFIICMLSLFPSFAASTVAMQWIVQSSLSEVEAAMGGRTHRFAYLLRLLIFLLLLMFAMFAVWALVIGTLPPPALIGVTSWVSLVVLSGWVVLSTKVLNRGRLLAVQAAKDARGRQAEECMYSARTVQSQIIGAAIGSSTRILNFISFGIKQGILWPLPKSFVFGNWVTTVDNITNCLTALYMAGTFSGAWRAASARAAEEAARGKKWRLGRDRWRAHEDLRWHAKVVELSDRGFTLGALLRFYKGLGEDYMEHWDSSMHTTADVVRHAIIPLSAEAGTALATKMMNGVCVRPQKMVTHNWGNRFRDLVAAICADALDEEEYGRISNLLERESFDQLESWLRIANKMDTTYWVCAFSINQHCTICGGNPCEARDTVTDELYPLCSCAVPKKWNETPPLTCFGNSIDCEVNKFDDMMTFLSVSDPKFEQVVAIDEQFDIFSRAWCVAELAAASGMGMRQRLKFYFAEGLEQHEEHLRALKIENMKASRPQDKDEIMRKIQDPEAFDACVQRLLFEELLPEWRDLDAVAQVRRLARIARWQHTARMRQSTGIWRASTVHRTSTLRAKRSARTGTESSATGGIESSTTGGSSLATPAGRI